MGFFYWESIISERLSSNTWVTAYFQFLQVEGIPFYLIRKGNDTSGAILVKVVKTKYEVQLFHNILDHIGNSSWVIFSEGNEKEIDEDINKQISFDNDVWVVEVEEKHGRSLLDEDYLKRG